MVGKKSGKALLREEGLARTDNGMKQSSWPEVPMINQKNYYTEYMKRDDQILPIRLQNEANRDRMIRNAKDRDRALAQNGTTELPLPQNPNEEDEDSANDGIDPSKIIVIHPGSQNLRIGFASDALPKTIPMLLAYKYKDTESDEAEPLPKRLKVEVGPEEQFGEEFSKRFAKMSAELKVDMRANKRKVLPNSKELVVNFNRRTTPDTIPEHNDPLRIEWTDVTKDDKSDVSSYFAGMEALRIPENSNPAYRIFHPLQHGVYNEKDYQTAAHLQDDFESIIEHALKKELGLGSGAWEQYSCVFVVPDLYDKRYVENFFDAVFKNFEFKQVAFMQESLAATYGAGYTMNCIVDVGAQKTSICCVEDGMIVEDSRINLKFGGYDVTETFIKMMLHDHFPYQEINLVRRYDFLLAEELKIKFCTMSQAGIATQAGDFHLRAPSQATRKYMFKYYDEVILAPMGFYDPSIFDNSEKLKGRRKLLDRHYNVYEGDVPDDPTSAAQMAILTSIKPTLATTTSGFSLNGNGNGNAEFSTPSKEKSNPMNLLGRFDSEANGTSRVTSAAGSPAPEGASTPAPFAFGANGTNGGSPGPSGNSFQFGNGTHNGGTPVPPAGMFVDQMARTQKDLAIERDAVLPVTPLDAAILTSVTNGARGDEKKFRDFMSGIMVIGGGAKVPGFGPFLEERLKAKRPDLAEKILVGTSPREMDGQVVVWKGAGVYGRMKSHESWIGAVEYERLGSRVLYQKMLWYY
ncbi:hypothetical protein B0J14DRAFT_623453 [Halenospora varia]|nr:hypothetical protein B0J14DRAFT_623453 [Halenospora varia]